MPPLDGTLALEQMNGRPPRVSENLEFDVPGAFDQPLDRQGPVAERRRRLAARLAGCRRQRGGVAQELHADPATAGGRFQEDRETEPSRSLGNCAVGLIRWYVARHDRRPGGYRELPGGDLRAHLGNRFRWR